MNPMHWESLQFEHYGIYQDETLGRFTEDPVHLVHFLRAKRSERAVDLGTGNGIVPLYANALYGCTFTGVDVDKSSCAWRVCPPSGTGKVSPSLRWMCPRHPKPWATADSIWSP